MLDNIKFTRRGFTFIEVMVVIIVLGILTAVAVPVFSANIRRQRVKDCYMQRVMISAQVQEAMLGMMDNGNKQPVIPINNCFSNHTHYVRQSDGSLREEACYDNARNDADGSLADAYGFNLDDLKRYSDNKTYAAVQRYFISDKRDGICDFCGAPMLWAYTNSGHVDDAHVIYKDSAGNDLEANNTYNGIRAFNASRNTRNQSYYVYNQIVYDYSNGYLTNQSGEYELDKNGNTQPFIYAIPRTTVNGEGVTSVVTTEIGNIVAATNANGDLLVDKHGYLTVAKVYSDYLGNDTFDQSFADDEGSIITPNGFLRLDETLTLADIRGGYRPNTYPDDWDCYQAGCSGGYFLKKKALQDVPFYTYFANQEMPKCPFDKDDGSDEDYFYYISADGKVYCTCPYCRTGV